ncbi:MAG: cation:proton antiporter [Rhodospirillaceae bacterium]|nr:cation:proton antiporter [Rhodospirillaceae bacterium]
MTILAELFVILIVVRAFGELAERARLPASVGEIIAGVFIAALAAWFGRDIPFLSQLASSEALEMVATLGIFVLVLVAGVEMQPREISESSALSFAVAVGGMTLPLAGGFALAWVFLPESGMRPVQALLTGVALSISAIPATVKVLTDLNMLHTKIGETIVAAAIFDDVLGLFLLAVLLAMIDTGHAPDVTSLAWLLAKVVLFFGITVTLGVHVYPRIRKGIRAMQVTAIELSALAAVALGYGWLAEVLGMHWILGAFMAGLFFERARVGAKAYNEIKLIGGALASGFLGPLFFAYIGLRVDLSAIITVPGFLGLIILVAFLGKVLGAGVPAYCLGMTRRDALSVGVGMSARGAVELVILSIAYEAGVFAVADSAESLAHHLYSALILVGVITTLAVPILLPRVLPKGHPRTGIDPDHRV